MKNNLFRYATKELSQDAFFSWLINWNNYPEAPLYAASVAALDLFLGTNKQNTYFNVNVKRQYKKIDVLVLFNDTYALIIEDKTNTSEHSEQIARYKEMLRDDYPSHQILTAYIKTGIFYDEDARMIQKVNTVVTLDDLLKTLKPFAEIAQSEVFSDYVEYISALAEDRQKIDNLLMTGHYEEAFKTFYGQYSFLNQVFTTRTKGTIIGNENLDKEKYKPVYIDHIYADANRDGSPWSQFCFWGQPYSELLANTEKFEYHFLFWRIDIHKLRKCKEHPDGLLEYYIALRHYDPNAKKNEHTSQRKKDVYSHFREVCEEIQSKQPAYFRKLGKRDNYNESDLLFIPVSAIENVPFEEVKKLLVECTQRSMASK